MNNMNYYRIHPKTEKSLRQILLRSWHPYKILSGSQGEKYLEIGVDSLRFREMYERAICEMIEEEEDCFGHCFPWEHDMETGGTTLVYSTRCLQMLFHTRSGHYIAQKKIDEYMLPAGALSEEGHESKLYSYLIDSAFTLPVRHVLARNYYLPFHMHYQGDNKKTILVETDADETVFHKICVRAICEMQEKRDVDAERFFAAEETRDTAYMDAMLRLLRTEKYTVLPDEVITEKLLYLITNQSRGEEVMR